jgi:hypothetical protein
VCQNDRKADANLREQSVCAGGVKRRLSLRVCRHVGRRWKSDSGQVVDGENNSVAIGTFDLGLVFKDGARIEDGIDQRSVVESQDQSGCRVCTQMRKLSIRLRQANETSKRAFR